MAKLEKSVVLAEGTLRHLDFVILHCSPDRARYNRPVIA
jgi:hypothetical protein